MIVMTIRFGQWSSPRRKNYSNLDGDLDYHENIDHHMHENTVVVCVDVV